MIQNQILIAPDLAFLPRLFITVLLIWLTGAVVVHMNKLLAFSRDTFASPRNRHNFNRSGHRRTTVQHTRGNWTSA
jgi:hypothetical protein